MQRILITLPFTHYIQRELNQLLKNMKLDVVCIKGPLSEAQLIQLFSYGDGFDGLICSEDQITMDVLKAAKRRLKVISKYGSPNNSLSKYIAQQYGIHLLHTPDTSHIVLAEHVFTLLSGLTGYKVNEYNSLISEKNTPLLKESHINETMGILGFGRTGKEVALGALKLGFKVIAYDIFWDAPFARKHNIEQATSQEDLLNKADIVSLHTALTDKTKFTINRQAIDQMKNGAILINCAHPDLVDNNAIVDALYSNQLAGYGIDFINPTALTEQSPLFFAPNCIVTTDMANIIFERIGQQVHTTIESLVHALKQFQAPSKHKYTSLASRSF